MIDPYNFISYPVWLSLPNETRYAIAALYKIEPRGVRQTVMEHKGGTVISDGFLHADLALITKESMAEITGVKSDDFYVCFKALVDKVEGKEEPKEEIKQHSNVQQEESAETKPAAESAPRRGRPSRKV
jgi:hypothetical protein